MTPRFVLAFLLALALCAPAATAAATSADPSALSLLRAATQAPLHLSFTGQVELLTIGSHGSQVAVFRVDHRSPDLTRRWYLAPSGVYGDSTISRGDTTYAVDIRRRRVVVTHNESFGVHVGWRRNLDLLRRNYVPVMGPMDQIAGRPVRTISLVNRYNGATTMRLWIDAATNLMLQRQQYAADGSLVTQMRFDTIRYTQEIPLSLFTPPASYATTPGPSRGVPSDNPSRVMAHCGFAAKAPRYLPEGFTPVAADLADENGVRTLHLLYSDGLRTVSLFENARGAAVDMSGYHPSAFTAGALRGQAVDQGPTTLLAWSQGRLRFALVGDLNRNELEKIAASIASP